MYYAVCFVEGSIILASQCPSIPFFQPIVHIFPTACTRQIQITPLFLLGILFVVVGATLRMKCYRTLGCLFTFELCIQENHTLVVVGPYATIRHPSYTALIMTIIGACFSQANGSWAKECGFFDTSLGCVYSRYGWQLLLQCG
jgi:protein-S-isoprenylcysteine O-methyltransferase Ste14